MYGDLRTFTLWFPWEKTMDGMRLQLVERRIAAKATRVVVAHFVGYHTNCLRRWERGWRTPNALQWRMWVDAIERVERLPESDRRKKIDGGRQRVGRYHI